MLEFHLDCGRSKYLEFLFKRDPYVRQDEDL